MNVRLGIKLFCLAGAAFLSPFAISPGLPLSAKIITGLIGMFTTINAFLDKGVANLEQERKVEKQQALPYHLDLDSPVTIDVPEKPAFLGEENNDH
jgi:hypothetical protein